MDNINYYEELSQVMKDYPDLVFNNDGYQQLSDEVIEANQKGFDRVTELLKQSVAGFVRFQNFKPRKDGTFAVRCQTKWDSSFIGVSYFPLDDFKPDSPTWKE